MMIMSNAFFTIDTIFAGGYPVEEYHFACYVYKNKAKVDIRKKIDLTNRKEEYTCELLIKGSLIVRSVNLEKFICTIEAMGYQLGDHENEQVALTEMGEQEVSLLTSIPYLFTEDTKQVER
jgi:hypothetical protein